MTTEAPWMRVFTRDWLARTGGLTPSDKGILSDLNAIMHERGAPVAFNEKLLAARCRATPKSFAKSVEVLIEAGLISLEGGFLWSEDMQRQIEFQEKKSANGKLASKKRHEKSKQNQSSGSAGAMPYQMQMSDTEGQGPSAPDPSDTSSIEDLVSRDTDQSASSSRLEGASDASPAIFRATDDPVDFFFDLGSSEPFAAEDAEAARKLVDYLIEDLDDNERHVARRKLHRLLSVGELTRREFHKTIGVPAGEVRNG